MKNREPAPRRMPGIIVGVLAYATPPEIVAQKYKIQRLHPDDRVRAWRASDGEVVECTRAEICEDDMGLTQSKIAQHVVDTVDACQAEVAQRESATREDLLEVEK